MAPSFLSGCRATLRPVVEKQLTGKRIACLTCLIKLKYLNISCDIVVLFNHLTYGLFLENKFILMEKVKYGNIFFNPLSCPDFEIQLKLIP